MTDPLSLLVGRDLRGAVLAVSVGFMLLEYLASRIARHHHETHDLGETAASFGVAAGQLAVRVLEGGLFALPFAYVWQHRLFHFGQATPLALAGLFLGTEFAYYWHHRASHRIRWMWATHAVHHSPTRLNLTAAVRLGWTGAISGSFLFFLPLVWIGFHPLAVIAMMAVNLHYQLLIHTELAPRLGPLEWVLNTPAHHCVHHASNASCLDRNYGGILIVFDRLFGSFAERPAEEALRYGLVGGQREVNPVKIALGEWRALGRAFWAAEGLRGKARTLFGAPGAKARRSAVVAAE